ncbi:MAG: ribonuclease P [Methanobrevibacter sp.]|jgi:ribonuclease P/MRP protein subunit POP5|nr:ribonuclease P [Methanobrevibacter sp.]
MKLKILPPTLRPNYRYLALDIKSEAILNKDELVSAIWDSCIRFSGELETSNFMLWIMRFYECPNDFDSKPNFYRYKAILKSQRGFEEKVRGSLAAMANYHGKKIAIATIGKSGTIKGAVDKFIY